MILTVLDSGSHRNGYILQTDSEALIIECGCPLKEALKAMNFNSRKVAGALITHEHGDHCKYAGLYSKMFKVYTSKGTAEAMVRKQSGTVNHLKKFTPTKIGNFTVTMFETQHDTEDPVGYIIEHPEIGKLLFATDTYYLKYKFEGVNHLMIECNYCPKLLNENVLEGSISASRRDRTIQSHFSIDNCIEAIKAMDNPNLYEVILLHLSKDNAIPTAFQQRVERETGKRTHIAHKGAVINLSNPCNS